MERINIKASTLLAVLTVLLISSYLAVTSTAYYNQMYEYNQRTASDEDHENCMEREGMPDHMGQNHASIHNSHHNTNREKMQHINRKTGCH